ncbi:hypothetical protein TNCV_2442181 [Trichonephila clavipes]|nr:hypothetical protein TNCV_2442181 [Trichonephila clavipes]
MSPSIVPSGNFAELNRTVTCMVLKANDRRTSCPCHDEFRGPRSDYVRQVESIGMDVKMLVTQIDAARVSQTGSQCDPTTAGSGGVTYIVLLVA